MIEIKHFIIEGREVDDSVLQKTQERLIVVIYEEHNLSGGTGSGNSTYEVHGEPVGVQFAVKLDLNVLFEQIRLVVGVDEAAETFG
jgi:hypothetical protein